MGGGIWNKKKDGSIYAEWLNISAIQGSDGKVKNYVGIFSDITEHKLLEQRLKDENKELLNLSNTDSLTALANRRFFDPVLEREWRRGQRTGTPLSVILIDIDCFKNYNDLFGHLIGDACLKAIARTLESVIKRPADVIARYGEEEFIAVLPNTDSDGAVELAEQLRRSVERLRIPHPTCTTGDVVTIILGIATVVPRPSGSASQLVNRADQALYTAKRFGRNRVCLTVRVIDVIAVQIPYDIEGLTMGAERQSQITTVNFEELGRFMNPLRRKVLMMIATSTPMNAKMLSQSAGIQVNTCRNILKRFEHLGLVLISERREAKITQKGYQYVSGMKVSFRSR